MSKLYSTFQLLPPPPPTVYSRNATAERAMLPDFLSIYPADGRAQVSALHDWLARLLYWRLDDGTPGMYVQLKICAGIISFLVLLVLFIILKRIRERSFWMVRFARKREGTIIIPNAVSCFTAMEGTYGILAIAL